jgi:YggT family protein
VLGIVKDVLLGVLWFYLAILLVRAILSWIQMFARDWRPTGIVLVLAEASFTATDPPLRLLRRYIPSLRLGTVGFDLSFTVLFLLVFALTQVVQLI